jgi:hypothetical protein
MGGFKSAGPGADLLEAGLTWGTLPEEMLWV